MDTFSVTRQSNIKGKRSIAFFDFNSREDAATFIDDNMRKIVKGYKGPVYICNGEYTYRLKLKRNKTTYIYSISELVNN